MLDPILYIQRKITIWSNFLSLSVLTPNKFKNGRFAEKYDVDFLPELTRFEPGTAVWVTRKITFVISHSPFTWFLMLKGLTSLNYKLSLINSFCLPVEIILTLKHFNFFLHINQRLISGQLQLLIAQTYDLLGKKMLQAQRF